jgi:hypothetical protein
MPRIASDGTGYVVLFSGGQRNQETLWAVEHDGGSWSAPTLLNDTVGINELALTASAGAGYLAARRRNTGAVTVVHRPPADDWGSPVPLSNVGNDVLLAASSSSFLVASRSGADVRATVGDGTTFPAATTLASVSGSALLHDAASDGASLALLYSSTADSEAWVQRYDGAWSGAAVDDGDGDGVLDGRIAAYADGYATVVASSIGEVRANRYLTGAWQGATAVEALAAPGARPRIARGVGGFELTWVQDDGDAHQLRTATLVDGGASGAPVALVTAPIPTAPSDVTLHADGTGRIVAVWLLEDEGANGLFASVYDGASWGSPALVATDATDPVMASNATTFLLAWVDESSPGARRAQTAEWVAGVWSAPVDLAGITPGSVVSVASDGTDYAIAASLFVYDVTVFTRSGGTWTWHQGIDGSANDVEHSPVIASAQGGYLVVWGQRWTAQNYIALRGVEGTQSGGGGWGAPFTISTTYDLRAVKMISRADEYRLLFSRAGLRLHASRFANSTLSGTVTLNDPGSSTSAGCSDLEPSGDGVGYLSLYKCSNLKWSAEIMGSTVDPTTVSTFTPPWGLASSGSGYWALYRGGVGLTRWVAEYAAGTWGAARPATDYLNAPGVTAAEIVFDGADYVVVYGSIAGVAARTNP